MVNPGLQSSLRDSGHSYVVHLPSSDHASHGARAGLPSNVPPGRRNPWQLVCNNEGCLPRMKGAERSNQLENHKSADQHAHPALALLGDRPDLFARQGSVVASWPSRSHGPPWERTERPLRGPEGLPSGPRQRAAWGRAAGAAIQGVPTPTMRSMVPGGNERRAHESQPRGRGASAQPVTTRSIVTRCLPPGARPYSDSRSSRSGAVPKLVRASE
jgi:hypothetical protein